MLGEAVAPTQSSTRILHCWAGVVRQDSARSGFDTNFGLLAGGSNFSDRDAVSRCWLHVAMCRVCRPKTMAPERTARDQRATPGELAATSGGRFPDVSMM